MVPRSESIPITTEPASAPETKKIATRNMARKQVKPAIGYWSSSAKSEIAAPCSFTASTRPPWPTSSEWSAAPPMMVNQMKVTALGISSTPVTNSRIVRPREMRAMKTPTKGAQLTHQAQ